MFQLCICRDTEHLGSLESTQEAEVALGITLSLFYALQTSHILSILPRNLNQKGNECQNKICPDNKNRVNGNPSNQWETDDKLCASFSWKQDSDDLSRKDEFDKPVNPG